MRHGGPNYWVPGRWGMDAELTGRVAGDGVWGDERHDQTLLVLGATGDLTSRLLLPGLGGLLNNGDRRRLSLIGCGRDDWDDARWRQRVLESFSAADADRPEAVSVALRSRYVRADVTNDNDLRRLLDACHGRVMLFFALPPTVTEKACRVLAAIGVPEGARLVLEKPFGTDVESARRLNDLLGQLVPEDHIYRVDHFLGKSTVLNILGLRFANRFFEPLLTSEHVECVDIVFDEKLALEDRAGYYDHAGALVDMVQSHLLQILALLTMEAPPTLQSHDLRERKAQVLQATRLWSDDVAACTLRARYVGGSIDGRRLPAYVEEAGVDPGRMTETLAEIVVAVNTWRWAGVPFRLRSGKAMPADRMEAVITFKQPARVPDGFSGWKQPDRLRIGFSPDRLGIDVNVNGPGDPFVLDSVRLQADFGPGDLSAYGEVLRGVLDGDPVLSVRADTAEDCWRIVEPVLTAWGTNKVALQEYPAGSAGPQQSVTGSLYGW